ncbi:peptidylprolyl isomerase [Salisaeta longa]|uniref:peptidylprolyl isomerase n=1 Tax=Salisaeta longa TaxID=503170 RepID=UPI0012FCC059|nr:peptidylprolyl isomerase [Salisaeta longa]
MPRLTRLLLILVVFVGGSACTSSPPKAPPRAAVLTDTTLQRLVTAQQARNGAVLRRALQHPSATVRARAALGLASVQDTTALPALFAALADSAEAVRASAAFAVGQLPPARVSAAPLLERLATESSARVLGRLLDALGKTGNASSLAALMQRPVPPEAAADQARAVARYGMRGITDSTATVWVLQHLTSDRPAVRTMAAYAVGRMQDVSAWAAAADAVRGALATYAPSDPAAAYLLRGLGRLAAPEDIGRLVEWTQAGTRWTIRVNAARALAPFADTARVQRALLQLLDDGSTLVAQAAAQTLAGTGAWTPAHSEEVERWIRTHRDWHVIAPLVRGLARNGAPTLVWDRLSDWRANARFWAYAAGVPALGWLPSDTARTVLLAAANHPTVRVAAAAVRSLADRWQRGAPDTTRAAYFRAFAEAVQRRDIATVNAGARPLADARFAALGAADTLAKVYRSLRTPTDIEAMTALLRALGAAPDTAVARPVLRAALRHSHPVIQSAAAQALDTTVTAAPAAVETPPIDWNALQALGPRPRLVLATERGRIVLQLFTPLAPQTVQVITRFVREGRYDNVPFHRVVPNFVVQGGDFARADGWGGPGFFLRSAFTGHGYTRGTLGMASAGKDTEGSQFFITHSMQPHLDGRYTAFGQVLTGQSVVDRLVVGDSILNATVQPTP